MFAACNLLGAVVVYFFLYESSGLTLENVDVVRLSVHYIYVLLSKTVTQMYRDPNCHPWTSRKWFPPGYSSRQEAEAEKHEKETGAAALLGADKAKGDTNGDSTLVSDEKGYSNGAAAENGAPAQDKV